MITRAEIKNKRKIKDLIGQNSDSTQNEMIVAKKPKINNLNHI
jgi:hypothetical protein